jgi:AcrR family transcriptional regulator
MDTREKILEATWRLLAASGGKGVRMEDIARGAGVSRQAVYLHFGTRTELLVATTRYIDSVLGLDARLEAWRCARTGTEALARWVAFWGGYMAEVHGVARALLSVRAQDPDAEAAWADRMTAVRNGCRITVAALEKDGALAEGLTEETATDALWALLSIQTWELLTRERGWSEATYVEEMSRLLHSALVRPPRKPMPT